MVRDSELISLFKTPTSLSVYIPMLIILLHFIIIFSITYSMETSNQETRRNAASRYRLLFVWHKGEKYLYAAIMKIFEDGEQDDMKRV